MSDEIRTILAQLANGEITTDDAERHIAALDVDQPVEAAGPVRFDQLPGPSATRPNAPTSTLLAPRVRPRVAVLLNDGSTEVIGDDATTDPTIDGPGSLSVVPLSGGYRVTGHMSDDSALLVPSEVDLELEVNASDVQVRGIRGTLNAKLNVSDASVSLELVDGASRIEANCSVLELRLTRGSSVKVIQRCAGEITVDPVFIPVGRGAWQLGTGSAQLEITGNLGAIILRSR